MGSNRHHGSDRSSNIELDRVLRRASLTALACCFPLTAQLSQAPGYADSRSCAACHPQIAAKYAKTGMARAFYKPSGSDTVSDYYHALSDSHYSVTIRNGEYFERRWQIGFGGGVINAEEVRIDYVMGSGNHAKSFLHRTERGMLVELPLGWYPGKGGEWAMVPGSDTEHPQTRRFVSYKCMFCHNAYPKIPAANEAIGSDPVFTGELPGGIDCQRCHGPGAEHVRASGRGGIINPAKLGRDRRMEVCMQCHLETTSGRIPAVLQRFDRGPFSFVPGQALADFAIHFDHAPGTGHDDKFEAVSSFYRLRQSRCYLESGGKLECATCHDPHDVPRGAEAVRHYAAVCLQCHAAAHSQTRATYADCASCHMPKRRVEDAPHVIMTDHLIQRRAPANALAEFAENPAEEYRGEVTPYYPKPLPDQPDYEIYKAVAQVGLGNNVEAGMPELTRLIDELKPRAMEFYMILADGWKTFGKTSEAAAAYRHALELQPDSARAMRALAEVDPEHAETILARAVRVAPGDPESWFRYGVLTGSAEKIEKAIALDPWLPNQSRRLAELNHSEASLNDALRANPFDDAAWDLGGRILSEKNRAAESFFDFERAIALRPYGRYIYDYALALARADRFDDARERAETALRADPSLSEAHELLGGLYAQKKDLTDARREYEAALRLNPGLVRLHLRLAALLDAEGDSEAAAAERRRANPQ